MRPRGRRGWPRPPAPPAGSPGWPRSWSGLPAPGPGPRAAPLPVRAPSAPAAPGRGRPSRARPSPLRRDAPPLEISALTFADAARPAVGRGRTAGHGLELVVAQLAVRVAEIGQHDEGVHVLVSLDELHAKTGGDRHPVRLLNGLTWIAEQLAAKVSVDARAMQHGFERVLLLRRHGHWVPPVRP